MTIKVSTGLRNILAVTSSLKTALDSGQLMFYNGTEPETADAAVTGSLLWTVTKDGDGTGITFEAAAVDGAAVKKATETWQGATVAGTPTYWRFISATEKAGTIGELSTTLARIQGSCGNSAGVNIYLTNPILLTDTDLDAKVLDAFSVAVLTN
jgi:hypothetical protein